MTLVKGLLNPIGYAKWLKKMVSLTRIRLVASTKVIWLHFQPQSLHLVSRNSIFPDKSRRLQKTTRPLDDFEIDWDRTSEMRPLGHVTVIQKGISFDISQVDKLAGPIYAVNWREKLDRQDVVYVTADDGYVVRYIQAEMFPILFLEIMEISRIDGLGNYHAREPKPEIEAFLQDDPRIQKVAFYHKSGPLFPNAAMPATSGLACLVALSFFAESIEVYGWDFYLSFPAARFSYLKTLYRFFVNVQMELQSAFVEQAVYNWHYAYRLSQSENFKNHGFLNGLENHPGINKRLDKIFYND